MKKFEELTDPEKIERLRQELQDFHYLTRRIAHLEGEIHRLKQHAHVEGRVFIPVESADSHSYDVAVSSSFNRLA